MGIKVSLSEQQMTDAGLQTIRTEPEAGVAQIARLRREGMDSPERREDIIRTLESYIGEHKDEQEATAASRAITTIMTVAMLEILQGD